MAGTSTRRATRSYHFMDGVWQGPNRRGPTGRRDQVQHSIFDEPDDSLMGSRLSRMDEEPTSEVEPEFNPDGTLIDFVSGDPLVDRPEERVRQQFLRILNKQFGYPKNVLAREVAVYSGRDQARDVHGNPIFADIVVYEDGAACRERDQGRIRFVVENKAPDEESGHNQLCSYIFNTSANGAVWYNGGQSRIFRRYSAPEQKLVPWPGIPRHTEAWDAVGKRGKDELLPLHDVRGTLARCHNKLHRRGTEGDDLTMDMVRLLLAKARDEERTEPEPLFYCTPEEYSSETGREDVAKRVQDLFVEVRDQNRTVFDSTERIRVGSTAIVEVVVELQDYKLIGDDDTEWDVMGAAYERYTADILKREGGEFFTNRLVVCLLTRMVNPGPDAVMLDPAGGTGGFCTATIRHMREAIRAAGLSPAVQRRRMEQLKDQIFYIDIKHRLVKIAKAAMILTGNGHRGFTQGDSLAPFERLPDSFRGRIQHGSVDAVMTNPPFAGTTNGKIDAPAEMVPQFELARRWEWRNGAFVPTADPVPGGVPPELLFIERCVQWLKPGGRLGIVVPKGVIENPATSLATRHFLFRHTRVLAVIVCHKNTFQPYTGSRTALLVLEKKQPGGTSKPDGDYGIFMAISRKIGQNSEGVPIFVRDEDGNATDVLDHDLDTIFDHWRQSHAGTLAPSEYSFAVQRSALNPQSLIISPQSFRPSLNEAIARTLELGETDDFTTEPLGDIAKRVFKGTRFRREDLETEETEGPSIVRYYTPGALLQDRPESLKYLDLSKATPQREANIRSHALVRHELMVTRSGSIGRVILTTIDHEGHIGSDDLIHIDIEDVDVRMYVYAFLKSELGQRQMLKNEYGTIQQHLEPAQVREILVPLPTEEKRLKAIASEIRQAIEAKERSLALERQSMDLLSQELETPGLGADDD